jgi:hypothetical protein
MRSTAETRAVTRPAVSARSGATEFEAFVARHVTKLKRADREAALLALKAVVLEAQAIERRRLCTDARYFATAVALTQDEIARHTASRGRAARITSQLASRARSTRPPITGHPSV